MRHSLDHLEPRNLLAQSTPALTDTDGDTFTITLTGPGSYTLNASPGADFVISAIIVNNDTTAASKLSINVTKKTGDGRVRFNTIIAHGVLGALNAAKVDIAEFGLVDTQTVGTLALGDLSASVGVTTGFVKTATLGNFAASAHATLGGTNADSTTLTIGDIAGNAIGQVLRVEAGIKKLTAGSLFGTINLTGGAKDILILHASSCQMAIVGGTSDVNSIVAKEGLSLSGDFGQRVKSISARALGFDATFVAGVGTITSTVGSIGGSFQSARVDKMTAKTSITGFYTATSWGTITAATLDSATFKFSAAGPSGFVIDSIKAGAVTNTQVANDAGAVGNLRIKSIDVGSWSGGSIRADAIDSINAKTDFAPNSVNLFNGPTQGVSIKSITVGGNLRGIFTIPGDIASLKASTTGTGQTPLQLLTAAYDASFDILKIELTGAGSSNLNIQANTLGTLKAKGNLQPGIELFGTDANGLSIKSLSARVLFVGELSGVGAIGSVAVKHINQVDFNARYLTSLTVSGGDGLSGDFNNANIDLSGFDSNGFSLKTLKVKGGFLQSNIRAAVRIGDITADRFAFGAIDAGSTSNFTLPANLNGFESAGRIDSITLTKPFGPQAQGFAYENFDVVAPSIGKITIAGLINTDHSGFTFGIGARTFGVVTLKDLTGATVKPTIPTSQQDFSPFTGSLDFIFRVYP